jgi:hypothetical protein
MAQQYNRVPAGRTSRRVRNRGRADTGRAELQGMDRANWTTVQQADRSQSSDRAGQTRIPAPPTGPGQHWRRPVARPRLGPASSGSWRLQGAGNGRDPTGKRARRDEPC